MLPNQQAICVRKRLPQQNAQPSALDLQLFAVVAKSQLSKPNSQKRFSEDVHVQEM